MNKLITTWARSNLLRTACISLVGTTCSKSACYRHQPCNKVITTCSRLINNNWEQAARTHSDIGLTTTLLQLVADLYKQHTICMWCKDFQRFLRIFNIPHSQTAILMTWNELLAIAVPGDREQRFLKWITNEMNSLNWTQFQVVIIQNYKIKIRQHLIHAAKKATDLVQVVDSNGLMQSATKLHLWTSDFLQLDICTLAVSWRNNLHQACMQSATCSKSVNNLLSCERTLISAWW